MAIPTSAKTLSRVFNGETLTMYTEDAVFEPLSATMYIISALDEYLKSKDIDPAGKSIAIFGAAGGTVPVLLSRWWASSTVTAYEKDAKSYEYLVANKEFHDAPFVAVNDDVANIPADTKFDIVISCPPFLPDVVQNLPIPHAWHTNPEHVVYGGYKGLDAQQLFKDAAVAHLNDGGVIATVHTRLQQEDVAAMLEPDFKDVFYTIGVGHQDYMALVDPGFTFGIKK